MLHTHLGIFLFQVGEKLPEKHSWNDWFKCYKSLKFSSPFEWNAKGDYRLKTYHKQIYIIKITVIKSCF